MNDELKIQLQDFRKQYKKYKSYMEGVDWNEEYDMVDAYNTESGIIDNIVKDLRNFLKENGDVSHLKDVVSFFKLCSEITEIHTKRIDKYLKNNDWGTKFKKVKDEVISEIEQLEKKGDSENIKKQITVLRTKLSNIETEKRDAINFEKELFSQKTKTRVAIVNMNLDTTKHGSNSKIFFSDKKASLIMKDFLYGKESAVRERTDALKMNWGTPGVSTSGEMYINMDKRKIPKYDEKKHFFEQSIDVIQFWQEEIYKITYGVNINGYFLSPYLYFLSNFAYLPQGEGVDKRVTVAKLRDNEYFLDESIKRAIDGGYEALVLYGTRRFGKSASEAIFLAHKLITVPNCIGNLIGFSTKDLGEINIYLDTILSNLPPALRPNVNINSDKELVLGVKKTAQNPLNMSSLDILNLEGGTKKAAGQKPAGGTPDVVLFDEIGKGDALSPYLALRPALAGSEGKSRTLVLMAGCVCAGTKVFTNNGKIVNIEDLQKNEGILGFDGEGVSKEPIPWMQEPKKKECYRITTVGGNSIECSHDHPFLTYTSKPKSKTLTGKRAEDLKVGDKLTTPSSIPLFGDKEYKDAWLVGYIIGDGYSDRYTQVYCGEEETYKYISENYDTLILKEFERKDGRGTYRTLGVRGMAPTLKEAGVYGKTKLEKRLPYNIHEYSKESLSELLSGYFDADGSVKIRKTNKGGVIKLHSICRKLLEDVKFNLLRYGIHANINKDKEERQIEIKGGSYKCSPLYCLSIGKHKDIITFYENIRFKISRKQEALEKIATSEINTGSSNKKSVVFKVNEENEKFKHYEGKRISNYRDARIVKIEYIGEKDVYNLTAGNTNTYLASGYITSNTAGQTSLSSSAETMLKNTEAYGILPMDYDLLEQISDPEYRTWTNKSFATFVPAQMSLYIPKIETNMADFLKIDNEELKKVPINVTDWKRGKEFFEERREKAKRDYKAESSEISSHPLDVDDVYLSGLKNPYNAVGMKAHKQWLIDEEKTGKKMRFHQNMDGKIITEETNDRIIEDYPYRGGTHDAPVQVFEEVDKEPPYGLYVIGLDDVKHDKSDGDSVISLTVYKRNWELSEWADRIVCTYATRPERKEEAYKVMYCIMKYYNAIVFPENDDEGFKDFLERTHKIDSIKHLAEGVNFSASLGLDHNKNRSIGFSTTVRNINRLNSRVLAYTKEPIEGTVMSGHNLISDIMLLEEMINHQKGKNADRIRSFGLALIYAEYLDKNNLYISKGNKFSNRELPEDYKPLKMNTGITNKKYKNIRRW